MGYARDFILQLFIHIKQNTCSHKIEIIPFFSEQHQVYEKMLLKKNLGKPISSILTDNILNERSTIKQLIGNQVPNQIIVIRQEGDFTINGFDIPCDCNHCLIHSLTGKLVSYKHIKTSPMNYHAGNVFTVIQYQAISNQRKNLNIGQQPLCQYQNYARVLLMRSLNNLSSTVTNNQIYQEYHRMGSPRYFCAPMIGQSELAFRMFVRHYGAEICYTPMILSELFLSDKRYREEIFTTCDEDQPLIVQFAANNPAILLKAAKQVMHRCNAIDINLGCPQPIGRRHYYGSWLMENWDLIHRLISALKEKLSIPVWCKIRIFESLEKTIEYAHMIESAGCSLLTVHGRQRKSQMNEDPADWEQIKTVKEAVNIPVISNGNIRNFKDVQDCLTYTGCDGVMSAAGILSNPSLFSNINKTPKELALEYLGYADQYKALPNYTRPHLAQILSSIITPDITKQLQSTTSIHRFRTIVLNGKFSDHANNKFNNFEILFENTSS